MTEESQHGKWTLSDSDGDDIVPPTPPKDLKNPLHRSNPVLKPSTEDTISKSTPSPDPCRENAVKSEPLTMKTEPSAPSVGSEAGRAAHYNQTDPVRYENGPSPAVKRERKTDEGGWNLSSSDDETASTTSQIKPKQSHERLPKKKKTEEIRPPSPHGASYYKKEPSDFFEANLGSMNNTYRFYLNKVSGIEKRFNTGALHIRGDQNNNIKHVLTF